jgi:hypothetical protein
MNFFLIALDYGLSAKKITEKGFELDDKKENIGSEDEENNGYIIGGDNHNNLEEDNSQN